MGIMDFFKNEDDKRAHQNAVRRTLFGIVYRLDDFENPSWQQIESAGDIDVAEDSFTTLSFINYGLEVDTINCKKRRKVIHLKLCLQWKRMNMERYIISIIRLWKKY